MIERVRSILACRRGQVALSPNSAAARRSKGTQGQGPGAQDDSASLGHPSEKGSFDGCPSRPRISAEEADALYNQIRDHLFRFDDLQHALASDDVERAMLLGQEYNEDTRLLNDIGWGHGTGESVELTMPPEELSRVLARYCDQAAKQLASEEREDAEARTDVQPHRKAATTTMQMCRRVLAGLAAEEPVP